MKLIINNPAVTFLSINEIFRMAIAFILLTVFGLVFAETAVYSRHWVMIKEGYGR